MGQINDNGNEPSMINGSKNIYFILDRKAIRNSNINQDIVNCNLSARKVVPLSPKPKNFNDLLYK